MVIAPARRAGDPGSNPGPDENFSLKLLKLLYMYIMVVYFIKIDIYIFKIFPFIDDYLSFSEGLSLLFQHLEQILQTSTGNIYFKKELQPLLMMLHGM